MSHQPHSTTTATSSMGFPTRWTRLAAGLAFACVCACAGIESDLETPSPSPALLLTEWQIPHWYNPSKATPSIPIGTRYVRIHTLDGPSGVSWREIEVMGTQTGDEGVVSNIAFKKTTVASNFVNSYIPNHAVDGDPMTQWRAGTLAPATITIDLGAASTVTSVALHVGQDWPGATRHVVELGDHNEDFVEFATFEQHTSDKAWLHFPGNPNDPAFTKAPIHTLPQDPTWTQPEPTEVILSKGATWVRTNPMVVGGSVDAIGSPSLWDVTDYFNHFLATAVHLTASGLPVDLMGWIVADHPLLRWTAALKDDGKGAVNNMILAGMEANAPGRIGYHIGNGVDLSAPLQEQLETLEAGIQTVRNADNQALVILPVQADGAPMTTPLTPNAMDVNVDVLQDQTHTVGDDTYAVLAQVRALGLWWKRPYWRSMVAHWDTNSSLDLTLADLRWNAYLGLLYGFTGHTWSVLQTSAPTDDEPMFFEAKGGLNAFKSPLWTDAMAINVGLRHLGKTLSQVTSTDVRWVSGSGNTPPPGLTAWTPLAGDDPYIVSVEAINAATGQPADVAMGFFEDDWGNRLVMIQNQHHPSANAPNNHEDGITLNVAFDYSTAPANLNPELVMALDAQSGMLRALPTIAQNDNTVVLEVSLSAGEPIVFQTDSNQPFPQGP